jgi:hypothetical protein
MRLKDFLINVVTPIGTLLIGLFAAPYVNSWWNDYTIATPDALAKVLERGEVKKFNDIRKKFKEQIVFDQIDLSGKKDLREANLNSIILEHANLSNANLRNSQL